MRLLMEAGLDINQMDVRGNTPVHYAKTQDLEEVVSLFQCATLEKDSFFHIDDIDDVFGYHPLQAR